MKQLFLNTCLLAALFTCATGCDSNEETDTVTTTDTSTTSVMIADTSQMSSATTPVNFDSTSVAGTTTGGTAAAKPNPAKKGMKGKASISNPPKSSGSMEADNSGVYGNVEVIPTFPGGTKGLQKFFDDNLVYPNSATDEGVEGTVNVSFVVDESGKLSSPQVVGEKLGYGLDEEALRVINKMPAWTPGKLKGKNVKTRFSLPVSFVLY